MAKDKAFRNMNELIAALAQTERELASGTLGVEGLETACGDARELYERLIVLRHKARETAVAQPVTAEPAPAPAPAPAPVPVPATAPDPPSIRLDTRPPEVSPRQVSLIEAIEATEKEPELALDMAPAAPKSKAPAPAAPAPAPASAAPAPAPAPEKIAKAAPTLAEKLERASIADLAKAISLSHKFWFVAELFNGDRITYDKTIDRLNSLTDHAEAQTLIDAEVIAKLRKPADPEALITFHELVKRRYA
jgi:hypothetical protein